MHRSARASAISSRSANVQTTDQQALEERVPKSERDAADLLPLMAGVQPAKRVLPDVHDVETYLRVRVGEQVDCYYRPKAAQLEQILGRIRRVEEGLAISGVTVAAAAATWHHLTIAVWVPVITMVTAAVTAHAAGARYEYNLIEYLRTAEELDQIRERRGEAARLTDVELVSHAERVISIQNEGWMAKLSAPEDANR